MYHEKRILFYKLIVGEQCDSNVIFQQGFHSVRDRFSVKPCKAMQAYTQIIINNGRVYKNTQHN